MLTYTVTGLMNSMEYEVQVRARNSEGSGMWSAVATGTPKATGPTGGPVIASPGAPLQVELASNMATPGDKTLTVNWRQPGSGTAPILGYAVQYGVKGGTTPKTVMEVPGGANVLTYTVTGLMNGKVYEVQVRARNANGSGMWSAVATGTPKKETTTTTTPGEGPAKVAAPMVKPGDKMLTVSWTAPASAQTITHYEVRYRATTAKVWEPAAPKAAMTVTAMMTEIKPLVNNTPYLVQVRAVDSAEDMGEWSDSGSATPAAADPVPTPALPLFGAFGLGAGLLAVGRARMRRQAQLRGRREQRQMTR